MRSFLFLGLAVTLCLNLLAVAAKPMAKKKSQSVGGVAGSTSQGLQKKDSLRNTSSPSVRGPAPLSKSVVTSPSVQNGRLLFPGQTIYGYIDKQGRWVLPPCYEEAASFHNGLAPVSRGRLIHAVGEDRRSGSFSYINEKGKTVIDRGFGRARSFVGSHAMVECTSGGVMKWFRMNDKGLIDGRDDETGQDRLILSEGIRLLYQQGLWGMADQNGKVIVKPEFDGMGMMREGLAPARKNERFGYVDQTGKWIIKPKFEEACEFSCGRARVVLPQPGYEGVPRLYGENRYGYIDRTGKIVVPCKFSDAYDFSEDLAAVRDQVTSGWGYIDRDGKWVVTPDLFSAGSFKGGLAIATHQRSASNGLKIWTEYIDRHGGSVKEVPTYRIKNESLFKVHAGGKAGFTTDDGKLVVPVAYDDVRDFSEGLAAVRVKDTWGFINTNGDVVVSPKFVAVRDFHDGMAAVREGGLLGMHWGYVDRSGKLVLQPQFDFAGNFGEGVAFVENKCFGAASYRKLIDKSGTEIRRILPTMRVVGPFANGLAPACRGYLAEIADPDAPRSLQCVEYISEPGQ